MPLPKDPIILLSYVNTQLRDNYSSLDDFVSSYNISKYELVSKLNELNYTYCEAENQFK